MIITKNEFEKIRKYIKENPIERTWLEDFDFIVSDIPQRIGQFCFDGEGWTRWFEVNVFNNVFCPDSALETSFLFFTYGEISVERVKSLVMKYQKYLPHDRDFHIMITSDDLGVTIVFFDDRKKYRSPREIRGMLKALTLIDKELVDSFENRKTA